MDSVEQLDLLKDRIEYDEIIFNNNQTYEVVLERLLEDSKYIALSLRYPYQDTTNMPLPIRYYNWQLRCAVEVYQAIGNEGIKSYAENGLSWTRDSGYVSYELRNEIEPIVGYIIPSDSEVDENVEY